MIYTSARWADEAHTMVIGTDADGNTETVPHDHTLFRQPDDGPLGFVANGGVIESYTPLEATSYKLYKSTVIRRTSEEEAVALSSLLDAVPTKSRMLWDASEWLESSDPLFTDLKQAITGVLGEDRANELLSSEA